MGSACSPRSITVELRAARAYLNAARARLAADGVDVEVRVLTGGPLYALPSYERGAGIDLVVMCSHGWGGPGRFALGSVADHLLRHGEAPVLLVRAFGEPVDLAQAVVPLDGSARADDLVLEHRAGAGPPGSSCPSHQGTVQWIM